MVDEVFELPQIGGEPPYWTYQGESLVNGETCSAYEQFQRFSKTSAPRLLRCVYAPFCELNNLIEGGE